MSNKIEEDIENEESFVAEEDEVRKFVRIKIFLNNFFFLNKILIIFFLFDVKEIDRSLNSSNNHNGGPAGRTVTLQMLLAAKMLIPGKSTMTIEYLVRNF